MSVHSSSTCGIRRDMQLSLFLLLFCLLISKSEGSRHRKKKKPRYCDYNKHKYHVRQFGRCKKCDTCPEGWGLEEDIKFDIDPVLGALGCRRCRPCIDGITFNQNSSFRACRLCKNCTQIGQTEKQACTIKQDTLCTHVETQEKIIFDEKSASDNFDNKQNNKKDHPIITDAPLNDATKYYLLAALITLILVLLCFLIFRKKLVNLRPHRKLPQGTGDETEMDNMMRSAEEMIDVPASADDTVDINGIPEEPITGPQKFRIAKEIAKEKQITQFRAVLNIDSSEMERIEYQENDPKNQAIALLDKWCQLNARNANKKTLSKALCTLGRADLVHLLEISSEQV